MKLACTKHEEERMHYAYGMGDWRDSIPKNLTTSAFSLVLAAMSYTDLAQPFVSLSYSRIKKNERSRGGDPFVGNS